MPAIFSANISFTKAFDYNHTYSSADISCMRAEPRVSSRFGFLLQDLDGNHRVRWQDPYSILIFVSGSTLACYNGEILKRASMMLFHFFIRKALAGALSSRPTFLSSRIAGNIDEAHKRVISQK